SEVDLGRRRLEEQNQPITHGTVAKEGTLRLLQASAEGRRAQQSQLEESDQDVETLFVEHAWLRRPYVRGSQWEAVYPRLCDREHGRSQAGRVRSHAVLPGPRRLEVRQARETVDRTRTRSEVRLWILNFRLGQDK